MRASAGMTYLYLVLLVAPVRAGSRPPQAVSPGDPDRTALTQRCPTFSWTTVDTREGFEIAVFELGENGSSPAEPLLRQRIAPGAASWTPPGERCLAAGRYAWTIRALERTDEESSAWGDTRFFAVEDASPTELEAAVERVLERWLAAGKLTGGLPAAAELQEAPARPTEEEASASSTSSRPPGEQGVRGTPSFVAETALYDPPDCAEPNMFTDVDDTDSLCQFIEQFALDQISTGCATGPNRFCPDDPVTRGQLAVYMERAMRGTTAWDGNAHDHFGQTWSDSNNGPGLRVDNNSSDSNSVGVHGLAGGASGIAVSSPAGVRGDTSFGFGVAGTSSDIVGVLGISTREADGVGIWGRTSVTSSGLNYSATKGVWGDSSTGVGVLGTSPANIGVVGLSTNHHGVYGETGAAGFAGGKFTNSGTGPALEVQVASGQTLQFRQDGGLVPGVNVNTTGGNAGVMRLRNALEVWPSDDATRPGRLDVRNTSNAATIVLTGSNGLVSLSMLRLAPTDSPGTCGAGEEGAVYYDNSLNELCVCTGAAWTQTDGDGAC